MIYLEKFKYWLINRPFFEMALYRKDAVDNIRSLSGTILLHLIKVKYLKNNINDNHWRNEIKSFFRKVNSIRIKPKNKKFSRDEYMSYLFIEPYCDSSSSYKKDIYNPNKSFIRSLLNEINYEYGSNIKYDDFEFSLFVNFFKMITEKIELDEDYFNIIEKF
jgi:competence CoiA-like predicted nuclease